MRKEIRAGNARKIDDGVTINRLLSRLSLKPNDIAAVAAAIRTNSDGRQTSSVGITRDRRKINSEDKPKISSARQSDSGRLRTSSGRRSSATRISSGNSPTGNAGTLTSSNDRPRSNKDRLSNASGTRSATSAISRAARLTNSANNATSSAGSMSGVKPISKDRFRISRDHIKQTNSGDRVTISAVSLTNSARRVTLNSNDRLRIANGVNSVSLRDKQSDAMNGVVVSRISGVNVKVSSADASRNVSASGVSMNDGCRNSGV